MNVQVKSSNGITTIPLDSRLLADRQIFIEGEINHESACEFVKKLMFLVKEDPKSFVDVMINSGGGEVTAGFLIYDVIQSCDTPIRMFCMGSAYSMAAVIFASGQHGRYMFPNSELMLHEPLLGNRVGGNASSIRSISESLLETRSKINRIIAKHSGKTEKEVEEATAYDHYFSAEESISFGLADKIIGFNKIMEGKI